MAIYFFTEVDKLKVQTQNQTYGPVINDSTTKYSVTSQLEVKNNLGNAKAYAVVDGMVFIQKDINNPSLINLVLKPTSIENTKSGIAPVKYFIYRGLTIDSFFDSNSEIIHPNDNINSTDLTRKIYENFSKLKADKTHNPIITTIPSKDVVGWDAILRPATDLIDFLFAEPRANFQFVVIKAGTHIGSFNQGATIGFEIVLNEQKHKISLGDIRATRNIIEVPLPASTIHPGSESLEIMRLRERILQYIDPAAYFMLFHKIGIKVKSNNTSTVSIGLNQIYSQITNLFESRNTCYIDIRNGNNYSLNYYQDNVNSNHKHFKIFVNNNELEENFYQNYWPIYNLNLNNYSSNINEIKFRFLTEFNPKPLLYYDYINSNKNKFIEEVSGGSSSPGWSDYFNIIFPNDSGAWISPAWYIKLFLLVREDVITNSNPPELAFPSNHFVDNIFGPINEVFSINSLIRTNRNSKWIFFGKKFLKSFPFYDLGCMVECGIGTSNDDIVFIVKILDVYNNRKNPSSKVEALLELGSGSSDNNSILGALQKKEFEPNGYQLTKKELIKNLVKEYAISINPFSNAVKNNKPLIFRLSKNEFDSQILPLLNNFNSDLHDVLFQFDNFGFEEDTNGNIYAKANIRLAGIGNDGKNFTTGIILDPIGDPIKVVTLDYFNLTTQVGMFLADLPIDRDRYLDTDELINHITTLQNVFSYDKPDELVTRIRVHYYGWPGPKRQPKIKISGFDFGIDKEYWVGAILFNLSVPHAPYYEPRNKLVSSFSCGPDQKLIPRNVGSTIIRPLCKLRYLDVFFDGGKIKEAYNAITDPNGGNGPVLIDPNNEKVNLSHAFYGFDTLLHEGVNGPPHQYYFDNIQLEYALDFSSFVGDIASGLAKSYKRNANPTLASIDLEFRYLQGAASRYDLRGDAESFGLMAAYNYLGVNSNSGPSITLQDILAHYYSEPKLSENHYSNRWKIFCEANGFIRKDYGPSNDGYIWDIDQEYYNTGLPTRVVLEERVRKFVNYFFSVDIASTKDNPLDEENNDIRWDNIKNIFNYRFNRSFQILPLTIDPTHIPYVVHQKFLTYVRQSLNNEQPNWNI